MAHDLVIRGGDVADGLGGEPVGADVAVDGGTITAVGSVRRAGREEIDAAGLLVTPGFVDIHTHYDGQATWDASHRPVELARRDHRGDGQLRRRLRAGAPGRARPADRADGRRRGHPRRRAATKASTGRGRAFGEYLDAVERRPHDIDLCAQLPHGALRLYVMGERAARLEDATEDDAAAMRAIGDRGDAGRRDRLLDLAHAEPSHRDGRPDAVAAGAVPTSSRRSRGRGRRRARRDRADLRLLPRPRRRVRDRAPMVERLRAPAVAVARAEPSAARGVARTCWRGSRRRWPTGCRSAPRWRRGRSACCSGCSRRSTRSQFPAYRDDRGAAAGRAGAGVARPVVPRPGAGRGARGRRAGGRRTGGVGSSTTPICSRSAIRPTTSRQPRRASPRMAAARGIDPAALRSTCWPRTTGATSSSRRSPTTPTAISTPAARCWRTPTRSSAWATAGRTSGLIADASFPTYFLSHWGRDRRPRPPAGRPAGRAADEPNGTCGRTARPRRGGRGNAGRPQRHRLRPRPLRARRSWPTTCRPAASGCCRGPRLLRHRRRRAGDVSRRRADRRAARPARARRADRTGTERAMTHE